MSFQYSAGQYANLLERALSVTVSPSADANFGSANLYDGRAGRVFRHGSNSADPTITVDLAAFTPSTSAASPVTFTARSGERRVISASGGSVSVSLQNLSTGKYLTQAGAWQTASTTCLVAAGSLPYQVESFDVCQVPTVSLKATITNGTVTDWPQWNALAVIGHNLDVAMVPTLRSSTDNFSSSDDVEVTGSILQPGFFMLDSVGVTRRYARLKVTGTNRAAPWYGELFLCYLETGANGPNVGYSIAYEEEEIRNEGRFGISHVYTISAQPRRSVKFEFGSGVTAHEEIRREIVRRSRGGAYPLIVVPVSTETTILYGRLSSKWTEVRRFFSYWDTDLILAEDPISAPLG